MGIKKIIYKIYGDEFIDKYEEDRQIRLLEDNKEIFNGFINGVNKCVKKSGETCDESLHPVFTYIKQVTDLLTIETGLKSHIHKVLDTTTLFTRLLVDNGVCEPKKFFTSPVHEEDLKYYKKYGVEITKNQLYLDLSIEPIVLVPWNAGRITDNFLNVAVRGNEFSVEKASGNIKNSYYYPMGVTVCGGGNHSQFSAKMKGKGKTSVENFYDMSSLYDVFRFDGINFFEKDKEGEETIIYFSDNSLEELFYFGLLFESGRVLRGYPDIFTNSVKDFISKTYK